MSVQIYNLKTGEYSEPMDPKELLAMIEDEPEPQRDFVLSSPRAFRGAMIGAALLMAGGKALRFDDSSASHESIAPVGDKPHKQGKRARRKWRHK